jgi:UDP-D-galactose:(glucosyl)LPS alpha-1,6-D-galactosyltransferase
MKKILIIGGLTSGFGGMETVFKKLYRLMNETQQYEVTFVLIGTPKEKHNFDWLVGIKHQFLNKKLYFRALERFAAKYTFAKLIEHEQACAVIAYDTLGTLVARNAIQSSQHKCPLFSWTHFSFDTFSPKHQKRIALADYHFAICDEIKKQMVTNGIQSDNIFTIYNPTSRQNHTITRPTENSTFLYIGRIQYQDQKNLQEMFHGLAKMQQKNRILEIVGNGQDEDIQQLKALAAELHIEQHIRWHGWQKNAWAYIQQHIPNISALLLTSNYEGFPMVLGEAMAHGIYCVSAICPTGPADIINAQNGLLYPLGDTNALALALDQVCTATLPSNETIQASIEHLYDDQYIKHIQNILTKITP